MLSIVVFSLILGIALTKMNEVNAKPIIDLFTSLQEFSMLVVNWGINYCSFCSIWTYGSSSLSNWNSIDVWTFSLCLLM
jgi:Na+/H+-dicarboxylate symporter